MVTEVYVRDPLLIDMNADEQTPRETGVPRSDRVGKVFIVVAQDERRCLICEGVFTRKGADEHTKVSCLPAVCSR